VAVVRTLKVAATEKRAGWSLELNRIEEVWKTESPGCPSIFRH
jgi:hypothetical protein